MTELASHSHTTRRCYRHYAADYARERRKDINAGRAVQQFIGEGAWDGDRILERRQQLVAKDLGEPDGSGFPKKGDHSVGVQGQHCGALGKLANCQQGVFLSQAHTEIAETKEQKA